MSNTIRSRTPGPSRAQRTSSGQFGRLRPTRPLMFGRYQIESKIGEGGMSTVHRATAPDGRVVAIKQLIPDLVSSRHVVSRFTEEAHLIAGLDHPGIVRLIDFVDERQPRKLGFVMELVDGVTLDKVLKDGAMPREQAFKMCRQIASALEAVHAAGIVHRDLKPSNVIVTGTDIKIVDFGIAKAPHRHPAHETAPGCAVGTPAYMAPEQITADDVTPGADVYALGEILYEMLTGARVFAGDTDNTIVRRKLLGDVPRLERCHRGRAQQPVDRLVRQCLDPTPSKRPTIAGFVAALDAIEHGAIRGQTWQWSRRVVAAAVLAIATIGGGLTGIALAAQ